MPKSPYIETRFTLEELCSLKDANWFQSEIVTTYGEMIETCSPSFKTDHEDGLQYYRSTKSEKMCKVNWNTPALLDLDTPEFWFAQDDLEIFFYDDIILCKE